LVILLWDLSTTHDSSSLVQRWHGRPATGLARHFTFSAIGEARRQRGVVHYGGVLTCEPTLELRQLTQATLRLMRSSSSGDEDGGQSTVEDMADGFEAWHARTKRRVRLQTHERTEIENKCDVEPQACVFTGEAQSNNTAV
jgi:hypothetical protein